MAQTSIAPSVIKDRLSRSLIAGFIARSPSFRLRSVKCLPRGAGNKGKIGISAALSQPRRSRPDSESPRSPTREVTPARARFGRSDFQSLYAYRARSIDLSQCESHLRSCFGSRLCATRPGSQTDFRHTSAFSPFEVTSLGPLGRVSSSKPSIATVLARVA